MRIKNCGVKNLSKVEWLKTILFGWEEKWENILLLYKKKSIWMNTSLNFFFFIMNTITQNKWEKKKGWTKKEKRKERFKRSRSAKL